MPLLKVKNIAKSLDIRFTARFSIFFKSEIPAFDRPVARGDFNAG